jgi:hypothetical protein
VCLVVFSLGNEIAFGLTTERNFFTHWSLDLMQREMQNLHMNQVSTHKVQFFCYNNYSNNPNFNNKSDKIKILRI